jgi:hypothetical protein
MLKVIPSVIPDLQLENNLLFSHRLIDDATYPFPDLLMAAVEWRLFPQTANGLVLLETSPD